MAGVGALNSGVGSLVLSLIDYQVISYPESTIKNMSKKDLVIIGGGFAGLNIARYVDHEHWNVILIDRHNYHSFPPLFYQVASSGLEPSSISFPLRRELNSRHYRGCTYRMGEVSAIDAAAHTVTTQYETIRYDKLVIAAGTTNNFFGIPDLQKYVYTIKSTPQAIRCRNEVLDRLERAALCTDDPERRQRLLTFLVVGGGPAGVEIAGAIGEIKRYIIKREYPGIHPDEMRVVLVEGADALLKAMGPKSSADALEGLEKMLVEVHLNKTMKSYADGVVTFADGSTITTDTVIWTAGVTGVSFTMQGSDVAAGRGNRWEVDEYMRVKGVDDIYAVGDIALLTDEKYPHGHPQVAQVAIQMGRTLAYNLSHPDSPKAFRYKDKGSMATIGRNKAVVDMGRMHLSGRIAWWAWLLVHLLSILGMRNRTVVFINWVWNYFTFSTGLRVLMRPDKYPIRKNWNE